MKQFCAALVSLLSAPLLLFAAEKSITLPPDDAYGELKPGAGVEVVRTNCVPCHSTDYLIMQPHGDAKQWQAVVSKMRTVYGAPINDQDAATIVEYLATVQGPAQ